MTDAERKLVVGMWEVAQGAEHILRRELRFTKSKRRRLALAEELVRVVDDRRNLTAYLMSEAVGVGLAR